MLFHYNYNIQLLNLPARLNTVPHLYLYCLCCKGKEEGWELCAETKVWILLGSFFAIGTIFKFRENRVWCYQVSFWFRLKFFPLDSAVSENGNNSGCPKSVLPPFTPCLKRSLISFSFGSTQYAQ